MKGLCMEKNSVLFNITMDDEKKTASIEFPNGATIEGTCNGITFKGMYVSMVEYERLVNRDKILSTVESLGGWSRYSDSISKKLHDQYPEIFKEVSNAIS